MKNLTLKILFTYLVASLISISYWCDRKFQDFEVDQVLFHIQLGKDDALQADRSLILSFLRSAFVAPILYVIVLLVIYQIINKSRPIILRKIADYYFTWIGIIASLTFCGILFVHLNIKINDGSVENRDWISEYYVEPVTKGVPQKRKNIILIYAESLETSLVDIYGNKELFEPLNINDSNNHKITKFKQLTGTGWTIAGIVATQCGLPLKPVGFLSENRIGENTSKFMHNAKCIPDILAEAGYKNIFLGGAYTEFAGKSNYLKTHQYHEIYGRNELIQKNPNYKLNDWGVQDDDLLNNAKEIYLKEVESGRPFNLTILTLGMHAPNGYVAPACPNNFEVYENAIFCTTWLLRDFLDFVAKNDINKNTEIVIVGDHLTMKPMPQAKNGWESSRSIFNMFITTSKLKSNTDVMNHFDVFPTVLHMLEFIPKDGAAGLGCSVFDKYNCKSITEDALIDSKLAKQSATYNAKWGNRQ